MSQMTKYNKRTTYERHIRNEVLKKLTEAVDVIHGLTKSDLERILTEEDSDMPVIVLSVAAAYMRSINTGDFGILDKVYDRVIGKSRFIEADSPPPEISSLPVRAFAKEMGLIERGNNEEEITPVR